MNFWPEDINVDKIRSPKDIMKDAGVELEKKTGKLAVSIETTCRDDCVVLAFNVRHRDSAVTLTLFEVRHHRDQSYPALIQLPSTDTLQFLAERGHVSGNLRESSESSATARRHLFNEIIGNSAWWDKDACACSTPGEFLKELPTVLSRNDVKSRVISLLTLNGLEDVTNEESKTTEDGPLVDEPETESMTLSD